jgi:ribosomal-protein-alanine N-acetyltransferase
LAGYSRLSAAPRCAVPGDLPGIQAMDRELSPVFSQARHYEALLSSGGCLLVINGAADEVVAFAACSRVLDEASLLNLAVAPSSRGGGLGRQLLEAMCRLLHDDGVQRLFLEVRAANLPARALYRSMGFTIDGQRRNYYRSLDGEGREDAIMMSCQFGLMGATCESS